MQNAAFPDGSRFNGAALVRVRRVDTWQLGSGRRRLLLQRGRTRESAESSQRSPVFLPDLLLLQRGRTRESAERVVNHRERGTQRNASTGPHS